MKQIEEVEQPQQIADESCGGSASAAGIVTANMTTASSLQSLNSSSATDTTSLESTSRVLPASLVTLGSIRVFLYNKAQCEPVECKDTERAEDICHKICRQLKFKPKVQLLFALRIQDSNCFVPACGVLQADVQYEFRLRCKMPDQTKLKAMDKAAFEYYYYQVKYDLLHSKYPDMNYVENREKILGLSVADMYLEMIADNKSVETLCKNYKRYVPKPIARFAKSCIKNALRDIKKKDHDPYYVMESYLSQVHNIGKKYLIEEYEGNTEYQEETAIRVSKRRKTCPVKVELYPMQGEEAELHIHYRSNNDCTIIQIADIQVILIERDTVVRLEGVNNLQLELSFPNRTTTESVVSGLATYYRLMVCWTHDLCQGLATPSLIELNALRYHGPIGMNEAYDKLARYGAGYFLVRQCDQLYDTYYLDIKVDRTRRQTYKIRRDVTSERPWKLHETDTEVTCFKSLLELCKSVKVVPGQKNRIAASLYDKSTALLLCRKEDKIVARRQINELGRGGGGGGTSSGSNVEQRPSCIDPGDLTLYKRTMRDCNGGVMTQMRADWSIDEKTSLEVTLKILKPEQVTQHLTTFLHFSQKWSKLRCSDILRIYGITLCNPIAMVMETTRLGPLNEWLRQRGPDKVSLLNLIAAAHSLARALNYLQERHFVHNRIRCSTVQVFKATETELITRLADPGINIVHSADDVPWIPVEYHPDKLKLSNTDLKTDIWAYGTTLWEMFSYGATPPRDCFRGTAGAANYLPIPPNCPRALYKIMCEAWAPNREKRFEPQSLFYRLVQIKAEYTNVYQTVPPSSAASQLLLMNGNGSSSSSTGAVDHLLLRSRHISDSVSLDSQDTQQQQQLDLYANGMANNGISGGCETSVGEYSGSESSLYTSQYETRTMSTVVPGSMSGRSLTSASTYVTCEESYLKKIPYVLEADTYKVVLQGLIGAGNFGAVIKGELSYYETPDQCVKVAVKMIKPNHSSMEDFLNESTIMKAVDHKNIVKIIDFHHENSVAIIMEYIGPFNLQQYLSRIKWSTTLTVRKFLEYARDIASGMEYLQHCKIVHRDLAARNVLVDEARDTLKISDFGLARYVNNSGYYMVENTDKALPLPWYAPETLEYTSYSIKSDVWSYGVTLFELFSGGQTPILIEDEKFVVEKTIKALKEGVRLKKPVDCPDEVYDTLMMPCWQYDKSNRPTFSTILQTIDGIIPGYGERV